MWAPEQATNFTFNLNTPGANVLQLILNLIWAERGANLTYYLALGAEVWHLMNLSYQRGKSHPSDIKPEIQLQLIMSSIC